MDAEGQLDLLFYIILYKGFQHLWILVSIGVLEPIPQGNWGQLKFWRSQKLYTYFQLCKLSPTFFKGLNYVIGNSWFTYFEKDKSMGANQNLLILLPVFLVIFLLEFKSHADSDFTMKMVIFCYLSSMSLCRPKRLNALCSYSSLIMITISKVLFHPHEITIFLSVDIVKPIFITTI